MLATNSDNLTGTRLAMPDAEVWLYPAFFDADESNRFLHNLISEINWQQPVINVASGEITTPRLVGWCSDENINYGYSGITLEHTPWTPTSQKIKTRVEEVVGVTFNGVLLNYYRDADDNVTWHSDEEMLLGAQSVIASVSLGGTRAFQFKHKQQPDLRTEILLTNGSLLIMRGTTQEFWKHRIPKSKEPVAPRLNLTFRQIKFVS
jgi:alkylated DNA repair dioxygenase AlkB